MDEWQAEVKEELCEEFAYLSDKAIEVASNYFKLSCPQKGSSDIGVNWYETH